MIFFNNNNNNNNDNDKKNNNNIGLSLSGLHIYAHLLWECNNSKIC